MATVFLFFNTEFNRMNGNELIKWRLLLCLLDYMYINHTMEAASLAFISIVVMYSVGYITEASVKLLLFLSHKCKISICVLLGY